MFGHYRIKKKFWSERFEPKNGPNFGTTKVLSEVCLVATSAILCLIQSLLLAINPTKYERTNKQEIIFLPSVCLIFANQNLIHLQVLH